MPIDGLTSGLDTTSIIKSLMAIERAPQNAMVARQKKAQTAIDALSSIKSKLDAVGSATSKLATAAKWNVVTTSTNKDGVVQVTAAEGASPMALTFSVDRLAKSHSLRSGDVIAGLDSVIASSGSITVDSGDGPVAIDVGGGKLSDVVAALNSSGTGVLAAAVDTGSGYRLQITSRSSGAASEFSVGGLEEVGGTVATSLGTDAQLTIGEGAGAYTVNSSTNTFKGLMPGVSIEAKSVSTEPVTVTLSRDDSALVERAKGLVDSINAAISEARKHSAYNATTKTAGPLAGDPAVRRVIQELTGALTAAVDGSPLGTAGQVGIKLERNGQFTFEADKFKAALADDPEGLVGLFTGSGLAQRVASVTTGASNFSSGYLTNASNSHKSRVDSLEKSIRDYDRRLEVREARMRKYWASLETSLGALQGQSSWLSGQLAGLNAGRD